MEILDLDSSFWVMVVVLMLATVPFASWFIIDDKTQKITASGCIAYIALLFACFLLGLGLHICALHNRAISTMTIYDVEIRAHRVDGQSIVIRKDSMFETVGNIALATDMSVQIGMYFDAIYNYMVNETNLIKDYTDDSGIPEYLDEMRGYIYNLCYTAKEQLRLLELHDRIEHAKIRQMA